MTHEQKINYMRIAASIVGYGFTPKGLDTLISIYELVIKKQGETDLRSISELEAEIEQRYKNEENKTDTPDSNKQKLNG